MIRVETKPEYPAFDNDVRKPGAAFLVGCPNPSSEQFRKKNMWGRASKELHAAYAGICAYTAVYLPEGATVDHYLPKTSHPHLAYEWSNFRLASGRVNNAKGNQPDILDPFEIDNDWFHLDMPTCLLKPNPALERPLRMQIKQTINSLRLNTDDAYPQERCSIIMEYARGDVSFAFLNRRYPFIAKEIERQQMDQATLRRIFSM